MMLGMRLAPGGPISPPDDMATHSADVRIVLRVAVVVAFGFGFGKRQ